MASATCVFAVICVVAAVDDVCVHALCEGFIYALLRTASHMHHNLTGVGARAGANARAVAPMTKNLASCIFQ